jgi:Tol biopolymer transport system component
MHPVTFTGTAQTPAWSPDGAEIAYASGSTTTDLYLVSVVGGHRVRITQTPVDERDPKFNPIPRSQAG